MPRDHLSGLPRAPQLIGQPAASRQGGAVAAPHVPAIWLYYSKTPGSWSVTLPVDLPAGAMKRIIVIGHGGVGRGSGYGGGGGGGGYAHKTSPAVAGETIVGFVGYASGVDQGPATTCGVLSATGGSWYFPGIGSGGDVNSSGGAGGTAVGDAGGAAGSELGNGAAASGTAPGAAAGLFSGGGGPVGSFGSGPGGGSGQGAGTSITACGAIFVIVYC